MLSRLLQWSHHALARLPSVLPSACALCGVMHDDGLCDGCRAQFFRPHAHRCRQCALPLPDARAHGTAICGECMTHRPAFDATVVATDYAPPVDQLVLALKFGNRLELAPLLARMLHEAVMRSPELPLPTLLAAVPLAPRRLAERGFNQALEVAKPLSRALGAGLRTDLVARQRETHAQALLHPDERQKNIRHAFAVPAGEIERLRGAHVGVVDDVMTTGATLDELAATLKRFGAARVTNLVFARTLPN